MKERLQHIIKAESLTNLQFAQIVEISPASVTHLLAGRNNPSIELVAKIARRFPHYNLRWLILGEGNIYSPEHAQHQPASKSLFEEECVEQTPSQEIAMPVAPQPPLDASADATKLIVCLPDGTYKEYTKN